MKYCPHKAKQQSIKTLSKTTPKSYIWFHLFFILFYHHIHVCLILRKIFCYIFCSCYFISMNLH